MGLLDCGVAKIAKSRKSLHIELELPGINFTHHLFINIEGLEKVLSGKQHLEKVVMPVHDSRG